MFLYNTSPLRVLNCNSFFHISVKNYKYISAFHGRCCHIFECCILLLRVVTPPVAANSINSTSTVGATENVRPDIARLDIAVPYRKGGHRETSFSVRVDAHYKFV